MSDSSRREDDKGAGKKAAKAGCTQSNWSHAVEPYKLLQPPTLAHTFLTILPTMTLVGMIEMWLDKPLDA